MRLTIFALLLAASCHGQSLTYTLLPATGSAPSARFDGTVAYDPAGKQLFLFGGQDNSGNRNDLWTYSLAASRWTQTAAAGALPPPRFGHTLVFDSARSRLILFGGQAGIFYSDIWSFDIAANTWTRLATDDAGPSRRYGHSAIYDSARDRVVISHGFTTSGRFDDTWAFDLKTNTWKEISPSGARPLKRCLHHAVYDPAADKMYLYGGCSSGYGPCPQGDLWALDFASGKWSEQTSQHAPPPREHYGMTWDAARGRVVIFGGSGAAVLGDTWEFSPAQVTWQTPAITGMAPAPRARHESAYSDSGANFFFGGQNQSGLLSELWMLQPAAVVRPAILSGGVTNAFSGVAGNVAPGEIVAIYGSSLGPAMGIATGFDAKTGLLPTEAGGAIVTVGGTPASLYYVSAGQINARIPNDVRPGPTIMLVRFNGQSSDPVNLNIAPAAPGLFPGVFNQDLSLNSAANAEAAGRIVVLFGTGDGALTPVVLEIGGIPAELLYSSQAPGTAGVIQINARVPPQLTGKQQAILKVGGVPSQAVDLYLK